VTARRDPVVVEVLTGFLGAGKTTLLNRLLRAPQMAGAAVLVNEFGEIGLDHLIVERLDEDVVLLKSGCVCCTIRGELKDALVGMLDRMRAGITPPFRRIVIETTGLADPTPILATIAQDAVLRHQLTLGAVTAVVDAPNGAANLRAYDVSLRQVAAADRIALTKAHLAAPEAAADLRATLAALNPAAPVIAADADDPLEPFLAPAVHAAPVAHGHAHGSVPQGVTAVTLEADVDLDWRELALWLAMLVNRHGEALLRLKGLVAVAGAEAPLLVQGVQRIVHPPRHLERWPEGGRRTQLVLIVRGLDPAALRRSFAAFVADPARARAVAAE
jgi:G3E family GTPase